MDFLECVCVECFMEVVYVGGCDFLDGLMIGMLLGYGGVVEYDGKFGGE